MTQYNSLNAKLSNSQLIKLKSAIKNETEVVLRLSSNMIRNSDDETNFPHKLFLTNRQVANLRKAFANYLSTDIKLSKTQLSKMIQLGGFLGKLLGPLLKTGLPLMKSVIQPLAESALISLGLTAAASAADAGIHKEILGSGHNKTLMISNDEMKDILKIVKSLEDNLPDKIKDGAYGINLDEYWLALYVNNKTVTYFDGFGVEHIPKEIKKFINNKNIIANTFRLQAYDSVMWGYFCIGFTDFMLKGNNLTEFTNLFTSNNFKKNDDIIF